MDRVNTEGTRGRCVGLDVVAKDGAQRVDREALEQNLVNPRLRLDRADLARDHDAAKPAEEFETLASDHEALGRPVAERVKQRAAIAKLPQDLDRAGDRTGH